MATPAIGTTTITRLKEQLRRDGDLRGGRFHGRHGGVQVVLYDDDDLLFTREDADAIEALLRCRPDPEPAWRTVVALCRRGVPVSEILARLDGAPTGNQAATPWTPLLRELFRRNASAAA
ncbi:MAG TPA: hypothetical protein VFZ00_00400 [Solirubrobacter sp.]|nr:hypothetical protein [Solirubrobacter sp.]